MKTPLAYIEESQFLARKDKMNVFGGVTIVKDPEGDLEAVNVRSMKAHVEAEKLKHETITVGVDERAANEIILSRRTDGKSVLVSLSGAGGLDEGKDFVFIQDEDAGVTKLSWASSWLMGKVPAGAIWKIIYSSEPKQEAISLATEAKINQIFIPNDHLILADALNSIEDASWQNKYQIIMRDSAFSDGDDALINATDQHIEIFIS